jgi:hypothetical protein
MLYKMFFSHHLFFCQPKEKADSPNIMKCFSGINAEMRINMGVHPRR